MALEAILSGKLLAARDRSIGSGASLPGCPFHIRPIESADKLIFVLIPFTQAWSDRSWLKHIRPALERLHVPETLEVKRADGLFGADIMVDIYECIAAAHSTKGVSGLEP